MPATFTWEETYGASPGTTTTTSYLHLLNVDAASGNATNYQNYPITVPTSGNNYSYERWVRGRWTGTYNNIQNIKFWMSAGTLNTGWTVNAGVTTSYSTPVNTASSIANAAIPTSQASALTPNFSGGYSDYIVLQAVVASTAGPGDMAPSPGVTYSMSYDES